MKKKILVVDDEPSVIAMVKSIFRNEGHEVTGAFSGRMALEAISQEKPDLIFLDIAMPGMGGWEVCRQIKQNEETKSIPIIMLTARRYELGKKMTTDLPPHDDYLVKPFTYKDLLERAKKFID